MIERLKFERVLKSTLAGNEFHALSTRSLKRLPLHIVHYDFCIVTLRAKHSGAVYCNRYCLWRKDGRTADGRTGGVCYHDNSKLRASIFTKLGM